MSYSNRSYTAKESMFAASYFGKCKFPAGFTQEERDFGLKFKHALKKLGYPDVRIEIHLYKWAHQAIRSFVLPTTKYRACGGGYNGVQPSRKMSMVFDLSKDMLHTDGTVNEDVVRLAVQNVRPGTVYLRVGTETVHTLHLDWQVQDKPVVNRAKVHRVV